MDALYNKIKGALYGVAIGDALGAPLEFMTAEEIKTKYGRVTDMLPGGWLNVKPGEITDDTQMTLAVCGGICKDDKDPVPYIGQNFIKWFESSPKDVGMTCAASIKNALQSKKIKKEALLDTGGWLSAARTTDAEFKGRTDGNGALMRTVYPALFYSNLDEAIYKAELIARMTHAGKYSTCACILYTSMIYYLLESTSGWSVIFNLAESNAKYTKIYEALPFEKYDLSPSGYVVDSFKCALAAVLSSNTFEDTLVRAVNLGGDADTIGAITGGIAGAMYGFDKIPFRWIAAIDGEIKAQLDYYVEQAYNNRRK